MLVEVCQGISEERRTKGGLERVVQTTLLGAVLPSMLTVLSDKKLKLYSIADGHLGQLHQLAQATIEVIFIVVVVSYCINVIEFVLYVYMYVYMFVCMCMYVYVCMYV